MAFEVLELNVLGFCAQYLENGIRGDEKRMGITYKWGQCNSGNLIEKGDVGFTWIRIFSNLDSKCDRAFMGLPVQTRGQTIQDLFGQVTLIEALSHLLFKLLNKIHGDLYQVYLP